MKRDMDLIRELLLYAEDHGQPVLGTSISSDDLSNCVDDNVLLGHINLLVKSGYMKQPPHSQSSWYLGDLYPEGYDLLDTIRDPKIWKQTKDVGQKAGGWTLDLLSEIAKGLIKTKIEKHTGVEL